MSAFDEELSRHYSQFINLRAVIEMLSEFCKKPKFDIALILRVKEVYKAAVIREGLEGRLRLDDDGAMIVLLDQMINDSNSENTFFFDGASDLFADEEASGWRRADLVRALKRADLPRPAALLLPAHAFDRVSGLPDPEQRERLQYVDKLFERLEDSRREIQQWESVTVATVQDLAIQQDRLGPLKEENAKLEAEWQVLLGNASNVAPLESNPGEGDKKVLPKAQQQEQFILSALQSEGLDPMRLPPVERRGIPGVKSRIRNATKSQFHSPKVFDKAWQRLRDSGKIADAS